MTDIFHPDTPLDAKTEQARRAVKVFRQMQPSLTSFARALTRRKDVRVELKSRAASGASTDGKRIFYVPPIALGDMSPHNRALCDKRDESMQQRCPACRVREDVLTSIYHEIAHICFDSFAPVSDAHKAEITKRAIAERGSKYAKALEKRLADMPTWQTNSYAGVVNLISPFLPLIFNGLEDARVNREMFAARPGTRIMFEASAREIFTQGVEQKDPTTGETIRVQWRDYPLNAQIVIGCYCKISGYDISGWFHPDVERDLADPGLQATLGRMNQINSPAGIYELSFDVLDELRRLGYCKSDADPEPEEGPDGTEEEPSSGDESETPEQGDGDEGDAGQDGLEAPGDEAGGDPGELDGEGKSEEGPADADEGGSGEDSPGDGELGDGSESGPSLPDESGSSDADEADGDRDAGESDSGADAGDADGGPDQDAEGSGGNEDSGPEDGAGGLGAGSPTESIDGSRTPDSDRRGEDGEGEGSAPDGRDSSGRGDSRLRGDSEPGDPRGEAGSLPADPSSRRAQPDSEPSEGDTRNGDSDKGGDLSRSERPSEGDHSLGGELPDGSDRDREDPSELREPGPEGDLSDNDDGELTNGDTSGREAERDSDGQPYDSDGEQLAPGGESESDAEAETEAVEPSDRSDPGSDGEHGDSPSSDDSGRPDSEPSGEDEADEDLEPIDTGADEGEGGTEVPFTPEYGTAEAIAPKVVEWFGHGELTPREKQAKAAEDAAVEEAIIQGEYFETPSNNISGVWECKYGDPIPETKYAAAWNGRYHKDPSTRIIAGIDGEIDPPESALGPALLRMRVAFADNKRATEVGNLKSGRVNARVLGRRVFHDDPRLFKRKQVPGKKDYLVIIGLDISGSTVGKNLLLEKRAVMAQANLLARMGIRFAVYAHTASNSVFGHGDDLDIYTIKDPDELWSEAVKQRLRELGPGSMNLDGHALEYLRKVADKYQATDKIILYYSDGKMPAENYEEELTILQREIRHCRKVGYTLLGVGIRTDSPARHGLDTVEVHEDADIVKVVRHIERRLLGA